jgi:hypothetical protein
MSMSNVRIIIFRVISGILGLCFLITAPIILVAAEGWQKSGAIPGILLGILFLLKSYRWE